MRALGRYPSAHSAGDVGLGAGVFGVPEDLRGRAVLHEHAHSAAWRSEVGHSASSSPTLISTSNSLPSGSASSTQPNSGRWSLTTRARSHRLLRPRPEACRRAAAEVAADHARPGEERSSVFADRILSLLKLPEYSTIYLIQAVMLLSCHHNRCHGRRCDDATC